ncbi:MAG: hypothetical protein WCH75_29380, partial [Candidatus Binatia bacterium]
QQLISNFAVTAKHGFTEWNSNEFAEMRQRHRGLRYEMFVPNEDVIRVVAMLSRDRDVGCPPLNAMINATR